MSSIRQNLRVRPITGTISTDDIIPGRYKHSLINPADLAHHVFENLLPGFAQTLQPGDVLLCDSTFGIGSSREQAVSSLLAAGVVAVFAPSFGRIFFRNSWNLGLLAIELEQLPAAAGDRVHLDLHQGCVITPAGVGRFLPPPAEMIRMVEQGGLLAQLRAQLQQTG